MNDQRLRQAAIRLAHANPGPIRDALLPLLTNTKEALRLESNPTVVGMLNVLLRREMTVVSQYMVQSELCSNWGYTRLAGLLKMQAIGEMKHAETLIERAILLEAIPDVGRLNEVFIGSDVPTILQNNERAEQEAVSLYNQAIRACYQLGDNGTRVILEPILADEEKHLDETQAMILQIETMGLANFLAEQTHQAS